MENGWIPNMSTTRLTDLAKAILENTNKLEEYFITNQFPLPSFEQHAPPELPLSPEMHRVRQKVVESATELQDLLIGPAMLLRPILNATSLQAVYKYDIASKVPLDGDISYLDLAKDVGLRPSDLQRVVRFAIIYHRVFQEKRAGMVSHSAASRYLAESPDAKAALGFMFDECYQAYAHTVEALKAHKDPGPTQSGWAIASRSDVPMWEYHTVHPELGERAARAMEALTKGFNHDTTALTRGYDWSHINAEKGLLVDLGGANGHVAVALARANPGLRCVVQDIPEVLAKARYEAPPDVADRVTFAAHDFFQPQPTSARAYLFRQIFHSWSDARCIEMLRALIPALTPGAKIIANDIIIPPPGVLLPMQERAVRAMDMSMMSIFDSHEREEKDWEALFAEADSRFQNVKVWQPEGSPLGLIEATWSG